MRNKNLMHLFYKLRSSRKYKKRAIFLVTLTGLSMILAVTLLIALPMVNWISSQNFAAVKAPLISETLAPMKEKMERLSAVDLKGCFVELQSLVGIEPWLGEGPLQSIQQLKEACFYDVLEPCTDDACMQTEAQPETNKGVTI
jgi:hypothetical protein